MKKLIFTTLLMCSFSAISGQPFITVGADNDNACDYHSIQAAIDSGDSEVIRIASNKVYFENVNIDDKSLSLAGGYADCLAAQSNNVDLSKAVVDGGGGGAVVLVSGNSQVRSVGISHMLIGNGSSGLMTTADVQLNVNDVTLINNENTGAFIFAGDNNVIFEDVVVTSNDGSGVVCQGQNNTINIKGNSSISNNDTSGSGGGLSISGGCTANLHAPTKIENNTAESHGGGINVAGGSLVNLNGIVISGNEADSAGNASGSGGAVSVSDEFSIVNAINSKFINNTAQTGGAIFASESSQFTSYAANTLVNPCVAAGSCTEYSGNSSAGVGGVFAASRDAQITVLHANIKRNVLVLDNGLVAFAALGGSVLIEGSMIVQNGAEDFPATNLFYVNGSANDPSRISLNHVTIADNEISESVVYNSGGTLALNSSIIQEEVDVSKTNNASSHDIKCAIVHETDSFNSGGTVTVDDPEFRTPGADYRIKPSSPAIDYCYAIEPLTVGLDYDIDLESRNYNDPNVGNLHGAYDIGADEYRWDNDLIFMHDFEQD